MKSSDASSGSSSGGPPWEGPPWTRPPWPHRPWERRPWRHGPPGQEWRQIRQGLFWRFGRLFLLLLLAYVAGMAGLAYVFTRLLGGSGGTALLVWASGCSLSLLVPFLLGLAAFRSFRSMADPLARVMAAAQAVADGDLSVRVPESGPGEFRRLAVAFNRMVAELQRTDQQRRSLTADVAHELRTPVHIIQGNLEGILDGIYTPDDEQIGLLLDETRQLARLVDDLRTLSLAEAGQLPLEHARLDVRELVSDAATSFCGQAEAAGIELVVDLEPGGASLEIQGDAGRLDQVLGNLIANALRHTPSGGQITLRARPAPGGVTLQVSDTGEGIAPEDLPFVFDRFWRADPARRRFPGGGSGLGLAIARQLVQAHGGRIRAESQPGAGTTFTIELPDHTEPPGDQPGRPSAA